MYIRSFLAAFIILINFYTAGAAVLISKTAIWKYKADGSNQGTAWRGTGFNDSAWPSGAAELGYGDSPVTTLTANKRTYFFRNTVNIANPSQYSGFTVNLRRDDGIVVYLNGTEVYRNNMPSGTISYITRPSSTCSDDGSSILTFNLPASGFLNGNNVIAAEVHNISTFYNDITYELELLSNATVSLPTITRGPYIQSTTAGTTILKWRTNVASDSKVQWGSTIAYGSSKTDAALVTDHEVPVSGLNASSKYFYSIGTSAGVIQGNTDNFFQTAPVRGTIQKVRIWALGDFGNGSSGQQAVLNSYVNYLGTNKNDVWVWLGDNAYNYGTDAEYQSYVFNIYGSQFKSWNFYPALGNHDYGQSGYKSASALGTNFPYFDIFSLPSAAQGGGVASGSEKYYSYDWANIHFIVLDSYGAANTAGSPMYTWLQNDLAVNTQRWTIVYFHHAPYSMGSHNSDTEAELIDMRQNIVPLLETYAVDLVLNGHSHTYERSYFMHGHYGNENTFSSSMIVQPGDGNAIPYIKNATSNGTVYAVCGVGGQTSGTMASGYPHNAMVSSFINVLGSLSIEVNGDTLSYKFLKSDGSIPDQFKIIKSSGPRLSDGEDAAAGTLLMYPNPAKNSITIHTGLEKQVKLQVYNAGGQLILTDEIFNDKTIDLSYLPEGMYKVIAREESKILQQTLIISR